MRKLSELCLQVSWVRPNDGVWCLRDKGHSGYHVTALENNPYGETYAGDSDQDAHKEPWILDVFSPPSHNGIVRVRDEDFIDDMRTAPDLRLRIDIIMKGDAFGKPGTNYGRRAEVVRILKEFIRPFEWGMGDLEALNTAGSASVLVDKNGNVCGLWEVTANKK